MTEHRPLGSLCEPERERPIAHAADVVVAGFHLGDEARLKELGLR